MIRSTTTGPGPRVQFTNGGHTAAADRPREKGGDGDGFGPHELLEAALATCLTMTVRLYATEHGFPLTSAASEVRIDRSRPGEVALRYTLTCDGPLTADQLAQLHEAAQRCPVGKTLTGGLVVRPADAE